MWYMTTGISHEQLHGCRDFDSVRGQKRLQTAWFPERTSASAYRRTCRVPVRAGLYRQIVSVSLHLFSRH